MKSDSKTPAPSSALSAQPYEPTSDQWHKCILEVREFFYEYFDSEMPRETFDDELRKVIRVTLLRAGAESGVPVETNLHEAFVCAIGRIFAGADRKQAEEIVEGYIREFKEGKTWPK